MYQKATLNGGGGRKPNSQSRVRDIPGPWQSTIQVSTPHCPVSSWPISAILPRYPDVARATARRRKRAPRERWMKIPRRPSSPDRAAQPPLYAFAWCSNEICPSCCFFSPPDSILSPNLRENINNQGKVGRNRCPTIQTPIQTLDPSLDWLIEYLNDESNTWSIDWLITWNLFDRTMDQLIDWLIVGCLMERSVDWLIDWLIAKKWNFFFVMHCSVWFF